MKIHLNRPFIWLKRFRHRRGYGVHSPFAFNLITNIFFEKSAYYAYQTLAKQERRERRLHPKGWKYESKQTKRMLFRLINYVQPQQIVCIGQETSAQLYLQAGCKRAILFQSSTSYPKEAENHLATFYLISLSNQPDNLELLIQKMLIKPQHKKNVWAVEGIHQTKRMKELWKEILQNEYTGISFDLYDLGIVFFDLEKIKQHYLVNF